MAAKARADQGQKRSSQTPPVKAATKSPVGDKRARGDGDPSGIQKKKKMVQTMLTTHKSAPPPPPIAQ